VAGRREPLAVERYELGRDLADRGADLRPRPLEVAAPEAVQGGAVAAGVAAHRADLVGRHVQLVATLVLDQEVVALGASRRAADNARVAADAVVVVDDVVAGGEVVLEIGAPTGAARRAVDPPPAGQIGLRDQRQPGAREDGAPVERRHDHRQGARFQRRLVAPGRRHAGSVEDVGEAPGRSGPSAATTTREPSRSSDRSRPRGPRCRRRRRGRTASGRDGGSTGRRARRGSRRRGPGCPEESVERQATGSGNAPWSEPPRWGPAPPRGPVPRRPARRPGRAGGGAPRASPAPGRRAGRGAGAHGPRATGATTPCRRRSGRRRAAATARGPTAPSSRAPGRVP